MLLYFTVIYLSVRWLLFSTAKKKECCRFFSPYVNDGRFSSISALVPAKHRITEWLRLTGTSGVTWSIPLLKQDHLKPVVQDHVWMASEYLQGWCKCSGTLTVIKFLLIWIYRLYFGFCIFLWMKCKAFKKSIVSTAETCVSAKREKYYACAVLLLIKHC